jgi:hypothetical protein
MASEVFAFASDEYCPDPPFMNRDFFKWLLKRWRHRLDKVPQEHRGDLSRRLGNFQLTGPPGVADHVLWTLMSRNDGQGGRRRRRG